LDFIASFLPQPTFTGAASDNGRYWRFFQADCRFHAGIIADRAAPSKTAWFMSHRIPEAMRIGDLENKCGICR
jgi:hypothetical protein